MLYSSPKNDHLANGGRYGIQEVGKEISFADLPVSKSLDHNHSLKMMERINKVVDWKNIEALLREYHVFGTSKEGADAYSHTVERLKTRYDWKN